MKTSVKHTLVTEQQIKPNNEDQVLADILDKARKEYTDLEEAFDLMGWSDLPEALKVEIRHDVLAKVAELKGHFSTNDSFVERRRKTVRYWVESYQNGICTLQTAIDAVSIRS